MGVGPVSFTVGSCLAKRQHISCYFGRNEY